MVPKLTYLLCPSGVNCKLITSFHWGLSISFDWCLGLFWETWYICSGTCETYKKGFRCSVCLCSFRRNI